jgi:hypothetical protein
MRYRALGTLVGALALLLGSALAACGDPSGPLGKGNVVNTDVDASSLPSGGDDAALAADSAFTPVDGPYGRVADGSVPLAVCAQCACAAGTYCYGGSPSSTFTSCAQDAGASLEVGCHTIPPTCDSGNDCVCLLQSLEHLPSCYLVCEPAAGGGADGAGGPIVYCPR